MLFNSIDFAIFLPIVFIIYWFVTNKNLKLQNFFLIIASYVFYGWWDWRFLSLIVFSSFVDYSVGIGLSKMSNQLKRKLLVLVSISVNLGFLGFFKYYNFFLENFIEVYRFFGHPLNPQGLNIVLPVGISFYTFQTLSYSIDVYRKKIEPTRDALAFFAFVSFFPQLVAGPIERAANLLQQFYKKRQFDYGKAVDGMRQILWGLFKKVVIADNAAEYVNQIFNHSSNYSGSTMLFGAILFAIQIYGDFSGYSDIAIGTSRLFGFELMKNFAFPYFSRDIAEFWRRWHISLTTWFRDYLYIPLGGSRGSISLKIRNIFIIFIVSGLWHGANWTFIAWGALNAIYFLPLMLFNKNRIHKDSVAQGKNYPSLKEFFYMLVTFMLTVIAWVLFRAENIQQALNIYSKIFSSSLFIFPQLDEANLTTTIVLIIIFLLIEWYGREQEYALAKLGLEWKRPLRWLMYSIMIFILGMYSKTYEMPFIYFQF